MELNEFERLIKLFKQRPCRTVGYVFACLILLCVAAYLNGLFGEKGEQASSEFAANAVPVISCKLAYPWRLENGTARKQIRNPEVTFVNTGPIKALAFSVDLKSYLYDKNRGVIEGHTELGKEPHGHFIFMKEFQPAEEIKEQVGGLLTPNMVEVYVLSQQYYREPDMKLFNHQDMFFLDNYQILAEKDYVTNAEYSRISQAIKSYEPPSDSRKTILHGIDDHSWVLEESPKSGLVRLGGGGKNLVISGVFDNPCAVIKQNYHDENRPLLYIRPSRLKETGTYLNSKIVNESTVKIVLRYEVENVGTMEAIKVSLEGGTPYTMPLMPGGKIYSNQEVTLIERSGSKHAAQALISGMDKEGCFFEHHGRLVYYQEARKAEYTAKFIYKIEKNNVQLIKYELN